MNRKNRRAAVRKNGLTWKGARQIRRERAAEAKLAAAASKLSPEEARKALAEWAARGGKE